MAEVIYVWYLEPKDARTNKTISEVCREDNFLSEAICDDGNRRNLWRCTSQTLNVLMANKKQMSLKFDVFCGRGISYTSLGPIRNMGFLFEKKRKRKPQFAPTNK